MEINETFPLASSGLALTAAGLSDVGCVRKNNEDAMGISSGEGSPLGALLVVADGMGGAAAGEIASNLALETLTARYYGGGGATPPDALLGAIQAANAAIHERATRDAALRGMGTTCTALAVVGEQLWFGHVGDSRAYVVNGGAPSQLTDDHSLAVQLERQGKPAKKSSGARNVLTRCLGVKPEVEVDVATAPRMLAAGSVLVLCSDGLSDVVEDEEIAHAVSMHLPSGACRKLVDLARERGAPDNVTIQVARVGRG